jgi:hypothetical protein
MSGCSSDFEPTAADIVEGIARARTTLEPPSPLGATRAILATRKIKSATPIMAQNTARMTIAAMMYVCVLLGGDLPPPELLFDVVEESPEQFRPTSTKMHCL